MKFPSIATSIAIASLMLSPLGCGESACTLIGCINSTTIDLHADAWPDGAYVFTAEADGSSATCTLELPVVGESTCRDGALRLTLTADGVPAIMEVAFAPETLQLKLERDGTAVAETMVTPERTFSYPNGKACGPECAHGTATVTLSL